MTGGARQCQAVRIDIRSKLMLYVVAPLLLAMLGLCGLVIYELRNAAIADASNTTQALVAEQAAALRQRLDSVERLTSGLVLTLAQPAPQGYAGHTEASLDRLLKGWLTLDPLSVGVTAAFEPGVFLGKPRYAPYWMVGDDKPTLIDIHDVYDYTDEKHAWYAGLKKQGPATWTEPFLGTSSQLLMTSYTLPILHEGRFRGVAGFGVSLERLASTAGMERLGRRDYALLSPGGSIVYHPDRARWARPAADYAGESATFAEFDTLRASDGNKPLQVPSIEAPGDTAWLHSARIGDSGWLLVVRDLQSDMLGPHRDRILGIGAGIILLALFGTLIASHVAGRLTAPLMALKHNVERVATGDLDVDVEINSRDEIGDLSTAFARMTRHLASHNQALLRRTSELESAQGDLREMAYHDALTGLPNRIAFKQQVDVATRLAARQGAYCAVLFVDIDDFKRINDTLGHDAGDDLLMEIARRLDGCLRDSDTMTRNIDLPALVDETADDSNDTVARLGGDEFTILLSAIAEEQDASRVASRIIEAMARPFDLKGQSVVVSPSCGIALFPRDGESVDTLLKHADTAMYVAKRAGKNRFEFFDRQMSEQVHAQLDMERRIREGLKAGEFALHFQPKVNPANGQCAGSEALLRWIREDGETVSPADFIPVAEATGLIQPLGEWVFKTACQQAADWARDTSAEALLPIAVNISGKQFAQPGFAAACGKLIEDCGARPQHIELELTESVLMSDAEDGIATLRAIKTLGLAIAVDDFGQGYSSLAYLQRFPIDTLKIDQAFVTNLPGDEESRAIARAIITMAHSLHLKVVAEGVETDTQAAFLLEQGCDVLQGWLYAPALARERAREWAKAHRASVAAAEFASSA